MKNKNGLHRVCLTLLSCFIIFSCSKEDDTISSAALIEQYNPMGTYTFSVSPTMGGATVTTGTVKGSITNEGNGVLRLVFSGFQASPMPFSMQVDVQFALDLSGNNIIINPKEGKGFFSAMPPENTTSVNDNPMLGNLPEYALENGLYSEGKSIISGFYKPDKNGDMQFELTLNPAVELPVIVKITSLNKL